MGKGLGDWNASVTCIFSWQHSLTEGNGQPSVDCSRVDYAHAVGWKRGAGRMDDSLFMTSVIVFPPQVQCMWVDRVLSWIAVAREASLSLSCPFHCGSSFLPAFALGVVCGLLIGICLSFYICHFIWTTWISQTQSQHPSPAPSSGDRALNRLSGYLHERRGH